MGTEVNVLVAAIALGVVQLLAAAQASTAQRGARWNMSSRDGATPALTGVAGRLDRAFKNFMETFPFFAAAALLVQLGGRSSGVSETGSLLYLAARVLYVPVYAAGITGVRSLLWLASLVGLGLVWLKASGIY